MKLFRAEFKKIQGAICKISYNIIIRSRLKYIAIIRVNSDGNSWDEFNSKSLKICL